MTTDGGVVEETAAILVDGSPVDLVKEGGGGRCSSRGERRPRAQGHLGPSSPSADEGGEGRPMVLDEVEDVVGGQGRRQADDARWAAGEEVRREKGGLVRSTHIEAEQWPLVEVPCSSVADAAAADHRDEDRGDLVIRREASDWIRSRQAAGSRSRRGRRRGHGGKGWCCWRRSEEGRVGENAVLLRGRP